MSEKEAIRRKQEADRKEKEEQDRKAKLEEAKKKALGPAYPKVWDLNYIREEAQKIFRKKRNDNLDWNFFKFKIHVNETGDYFTTNFYEALEELKWKNTEKVKDIRKSKFNINGIFSMLWPLCMF